MSNLKEKVSFLKVYSPVFLSLAFNTSLFIVFIFISYKSRHALPTRTHALYLFIAFSFCSFLIAAVFTHSFYRNLNQITRYARDISGGGGDLRQSAPIAGHWRELALNIDMAAQKLRREAGAATEEKNRLSAILESMAEGVAVIGGDEKMLLMNTVLSRSIGLDKAQVPGRYYWEVFRDLEINQMIEKGLQDSVIARKEHTLMFSGVIYEIQVSPVFADGEFRGVVAVFHDVTKLKELERVRAEFVANVSHELKTPLTSILGFVETLKAGGVEDIENRGKFLEIIEQQAAKLHELIEDLLLLSKAESGKQELKKEPLDLGQLLGSVLSLFERALEAKKIRVRLDIDPQPFFIHAEPKMIDQVFLNLVDNAIKYNRQGGEILFKAREEPACVKIEVRDTGIGIPEADLPRIFERFYRVDKSRSREYGGSGLGLSIAKHIVERNAGRIEAASLQQNGASFTITLPKI